MALVGREVELGRLSAAIRSARDGIASVLVFRGPAGIGKTSILDEAIGLAAGFDVIRTAGVDAESGIAYATLHAMFHADHESIASLPEPARSAMLSALALGPPTMSDPLALGVATLSYLTRRATAGPLAVIIDDFHAVDPASRTALLFALRRLGNDPIVALVALRDTPVVDTASLAVVEVGPLKRHDVEALLGSPNFASDVLHELAARSDGNPLAALELARDLSERQRRGLEPLGHAPVVGTASIELFRRPIQGLSDDARRSLLAAALMATPRVSLVRRAVGAPETSRAIAELEEAHLLVCNADEIRFPHPLVRGAVLALSSSSYTRASHQAIAEAMPNGPEQILHAAHGLTGPDESVALQLEHLAAGSLMQGDPHRSFHLAAMAAGASASAASASPRHLLAAQAAAMAGLPADAHVDALFADGPAYLRPEAAVVAAAIAAFRGHGGAFDQLIETMDEWSGVDRDAAATVCAFATTERWNHLDIASADSLARRGLELADGQLALPRPFGVMPALAFVTFSSLTTGLEDDSMLDACAAVTIERGEVDSAFMLAMGFVVNGRFRDGLAFVGTMHAQAIGRGAVSAAMWLAIAAGMMHRRRGALIDARRWISRGSDLADCVDSGPLAQSLASAELAVLSALQGDVGESRRYQAKVDLLLRSITSEPSATIANEAAFHCLVVEGKLADAAALFEDRPLPAGRVAEIFPVAFDAVEVLVRLGRVNDAIALTESLRERGPTRSVGHDGRVIRCQGLCSAGNESPALFATSIERSRESGNDLDVARTELVLGERLQRLGERTQSRAHLERSLDAFESQACGPWAARAQLLLRATGPRRHRPVADGTEPLTAVEDQVAHAVVSGRSNRAIASELFLSVKTVEAHLTRIYRKIGVSSRTELTAVLLGRERTSME